MYINYKRKVECRKRDWEKHYPIYTIQCSHYIKPQTIKKNRLNFNHEMQYSLYALVQVVEKGNFFFPCFQLFFSARNFCSFTDHSFHYSRYKILFNFQYILDGSFNCTLQSLPLSIQFWIQHNRHTFFSNMLSLFTFFFFLNTVHTMLFQWAPQNMGFSVLLRSALAIQMALTTRNNTHLH